jgi:hypothetical protein
MISFKRPKAAPRKRPILDVIRWPQEYFGCRLGTDGEVNTPVTQGCAQRVGFAVSKYSRGLVPELIFHGQTFYWEDICGLTYAEKVKGIKAKQATEARRQKKHQRQAKSSQPGNSP